MASAAAVTQQLVIKPEDTYGTEKATTGVDYRRLNSLVVMPGTTFEVDMFMASGSMVADIAILNDDFTEGDGEGRLDYNAAPYIISSILGSETPTELGTSSGAFEWVWLWNGKDKIVPQSYSLGYGDTAAGESEKVLGWIFNQLGISGGRGGFELSTGGFGKRMTTSATLGTIGTDMDVPPIPVSPLDGSIFMDTSWANAAGGSPSRLLDIYEMELDVAERYARTRPINALQTSDGVVENSDQEHTVALTFGVNPTERAQFAKIRAGTKSFVKVLFEGATIASTFKYTVEFIMCILWQEAGPPEDSDNVLTRQWTGRLARDPISGNAIKVRVINTRDEL